MLSQIFETELTEIDSQIAELEAKRKKLQDKWNLYNQFQTQTNDHLKGLSNLKEKLAETIGTDAIASLKSAVLTLFADGSDGGNDSGNQPEPPAPEPDDSGNEVSGLKEETENPVTSTDLTDADEAGETDIPDIKASLSYVQQIKNRCSACWGYEVCSKADIKSGLINRTNLNFMEAVNLERKGKEFYQTVETYLDRFYYNGQTCEWASPLASPLCSQAWEDAPLLGQHCQWASPFACPVEFSKPEPSKRPNRVQPAFGLKSGGVDDSESEPEKPAFTDFVDVSDRVGYLKIQHSGEIKATYAGFTQKQRAESWGKWLAVRHSVASGFEVRPAKHLPFKWELKLWGLNINQINRLASEDLTSSPHTEVDSVKPPSYKKPQPLQPVKPEGVKPGDIVAPLLSPENTYEVVQIMPNGILDCKSLKTGVNMGMRPAAVSLVSKPEQEAGIIQVGNLIEVKDPADGEPKTGIVQEIHRNPLAPIVVLFKDGSVEEFYRSQVKLLRDIPVPAIAFNDLVEIPGQTGAFGRVKIIKDSRIGVEVDEQLEYFDAKKLKIKVLAADEATEVAALELVKSGMARELALATAEEDYDF